MFWIKVKKLFSYFVYLHNCRIHLFEPLAGKSAFLLIVSYCYFYVPDTTLKGCVSPPRTELGKITHTN